MGPTASTKVSRLLYGSPLARPLGATVTIIVLIALMVFTLLMILDTLGTLDSNGTQVFVRALAVSALLTLVPVLILRFLDRREPEAPVMFAIALLWGGLIATGLALPFNNAILQGVYNAISTEPTITEFLGDDAAFLIGAPLAGPLVEEITKGLGVLVLFWLFRAEFDNLRDGFIYGALVGAGFNLLEAPLYVAQGFAETGVAPFGFQLGGRFALFGLAGHALYTGMFGAFLGLARQTATRWLHWAAPFVGLLLAISAHFLNNVLGLIITIIMRLNGEPLPEPGPLPDISLAASFFSSSLRTLILFFPYLLLMGILLYISGDWERRTIRQELEEEIPNCVTPDEYEAICNDRILRTRRVDKLRRRASQLRVRAQNELAFRKYRVRHDGGDPQTDPLVQAWRAELIGMNE
jgi:RsiW-degrading membrane proteinase PrsW (M82 family)